MATSTSSPFLRNLVDHSKRDRPFLLSVLLIAAFIASVISPSISGISLVRAMSGFLLLSVLPGFLILWTLRDDFRLSDCLYAVGLSVSISMFVGWAANTVYRQTGVLGPPFTETYSILIYVCTTSGLTAFLWWYSRTNEIDGPAYRLFHSDGYSSRVLISLLCLPLLAVAGAVILNKTGENAVSLAVILLCGIVPPLVLKFDRKKRYFGWALLAISLSLILQNTIFMTYLAFGDGVAEYRIANTVLQNGYWVPGSAKSGMPRIGVLHPMYALLLDIDLLWEFKLVHPLLFSLAPLIGYELSSRYFSKEVAFIGGALYVFLPEVYRLLARNTRTGSAILFALFLIAVILDSELQERTQVALLVTFFWAVISSHYGIGPVLFLLLIPSYVMYRAMQTLKGRSDSLIRVNTFILFGIVMYSWYAYLTGGTFRFVALSIFKRVYGQIFLRQSSTAVNAVSFEMPSLSYKVLFYLHLLIAALACFAIGVLFLLHVSDIFSVDHPFLERLRATVQKDTTGALMDGAYLSVISGLALLFPLSFGPNVLSSARTFGFLLAFLGPFVVLSTRFSVLRRLKFKPVLTLLIILLLFTSGFISAIATHEPSRQPNLDRERIIESGENVEQFALYRVYNSKSSLFASGFIASNLPRGATVHKSALSDYLPLFTASRSQPLETKIAENASVLREGYVYVSEADSVTGVYTTSFQGFVYYDSFNIEKIPKKSKVYTNGDSNVLYG